MKRKSKFLRILSCLLVCVIFSCSLSFATDLDQSIIENEVILETIHYDDGSYAEVSLIENDNPGSATVLSTSTKTANKKYTYYNASGTACWYYKVTGTFSYNGSSSKATGVTASRKLYSSSWSYVSESHTYSSNVASGTATFKNSSNTRKRITLTITCSKNGTIS